MIEGYVEAMCVWKVERETDPWTATEFTQTILGNIWTKRGEKHEAMKHVIDTKTV